MKRKNEPVYQMSWTWSCWSCKNAIWKICCDADIVLPHGLGQSTAGVGGPDLHHKERQTFSRKWCQNLGFQEDETWYFNMTFRRWEIFRLDLRWFDLGLDVSFWDTYISMITRLANLNHPPVPSSKSTTDLGVDPRLGLRGKNGLQR